MAKVILVCGPIASGKTEYAKRLIAGCRGILLSVDEIMLALFGSDAGDGHDALVERGQAYLLAKAVELVGRGVDVVLDWGFWTAEERREVTAFWGSRNICVQWHCMEVSRDVLERNLARRNREIEAGSVKFYYFDDALAARF